MNVDTHEEDGELDKIKKDRGYNYEDVIELLPEKLPNYEEMIYTEVTELLDNLYLNGYLLFLCNISSWSYSLLNICMLTKKSDSFWLAPVFSMYKD